MLGLGLAASSVPSMYRGAAEWTKIHDWLTGDAPQPLELAEETAEVVAGQVERIEANLKAMRDQLESYKPDAIAIVVSDSGRLYTNVQVPQFTTYVGDTAWGSTRYAELNENAADDMVEFPCASDLGNFVQRELVAHGFDMNYSRLMNPLGQPEFDMSVSLVGAVRALVPGLDVPILPIIVNAHVPPSPSGRRCRAFGEALGEILHEPPERIVLLASGGLSHDYHGPRAGWVDYPFDEWLLEQLKRGKGANLDTIWDLESDSIHGGVAEVRLWAIVAGACERLGAKAEVLDYFPSYSAGAGIGFARWDTAGAGG